MRTSSMLTRQISRGRGVSGARKLIPMPLRISRAPGRPTLICVRQSTISRIVAFVFPRVGARRNVRALQPIRARSTRASIAGLTDNGRLRTDNDASHAIRGSGLPFPRQTADSEISAVVAQEDDEVAARHFTDTAPNRPDEKAGPFWKGSFRASQ